MQWRTKKIIKFWNYFECITQKNHFQNEWSTFTDSGNVFEICLEYFFQIPRSIIRNYNKLIVFHKLVWLWLIHDWSYKNIINQQRNLKLSMLIYTLNITKQKYLPLDWYRIWFGRSIMYLNNYIFIPIIYETR